MNPSHSYGWVGFVGLVDADCTVTIEDCVSIGNLQEVLHQAHLLAPMEAIRRITRVV